MKFKIHYWSQWFAALNVFMLTTTVGLSYGWISPFLGNLSRPNPHFEVTQEQMTWIASLINIGQPIGTVLGSVMANTWGSKISTHSSGIFFVSAGLLLMFAKTVYIVFASLTFLGISIGIVYTIFPIYLAEMSDSNIRGLLVSFVAHGVVIGMVLGNFLGAEFSPTTFGCINFVVILMCAISFAFVPSTPQYLISRKNMKQAENAFKWYNQNTEPAEELKKISEFLETSPKLSARELIKPINVKVLMIICMIHGLTELFGSMITMSYAEVIFIESKIVLMNPAVLVTILNALAIPVCWLSMYTTDKYGRVTMLLIAYALLCMALASWSFNFFLLEKGFDELKLQWISILSALVFRVGLSLGITPIVTTLIGELYAPNFKPIGCCIHGIFSAIWLFVSSKNFQFLVDNLTYKYTFMLLAVCMFLIGLCVTFIVPETKGKTLQEIQEMLNKDVNQISEKSSI